MPRFIGIGADTVTHEDGTKVEPIATLSFACKTKPDDENYSTEYSVAFPIQDFCQTRLTGGTDKNGNPAKLSWYSHWKETDGEITYTGKNPGPSVASIYRLSHLQQQCLRESQAYKDFVDGSDFTDSEKAELKKFSRSHGSTREGGTQTTAQKTQRILDTLQEQGLTIVGSEHLTPAEKSDLADTIERAAQAIVAECRVPLADYLELKASIANAEKELEKATGNLQEILDDPDQFTDKPEVMVERIQAKQTAENTLAELRAKAEPPPAEEPDAETSDTPDADESEETSNPAESTADQTTEDGAEQDA